MSSQKVVESGEEIILGLVVHLQSCVKISLEHCLQNSVGPDCRIILLINKNISLFCHSRVFKLSG